MKKPLATRILSLAVIYCLVFFFLVLLQFSGKGNFNLPVGAMTIKGRYLDPDKTRAVTAVRALSGGVKIFFGGLEFNLKDDREKGLTLTGAHGKIPVNPGFLTLGENTARFDLPDGSTIVFNSINSAIGQELQISAEFADNVWEASIAISPRRSSLVRENGQLGILYNGSRYLFSTLGQELESGKLTLSNENTFIAYRSRGKQKEFNPEDFIIPQTQNYEREVASWRDSSYNFWNQNAASLFNSDDIAAYCAEALRRGQYSTAVRSIPPGFLTSQQNSYKSSGYVGGIDSAFKSFTAEEQEKLNKIYRLTRAQSPDVFKEEHLLDFLLARGNNSLANEVLDLLNNTDSKNLTVEYCPGLLEFYSDFKRWRPTLSNPVESFTEQIILLISENLSRDTEKDLVYVTYSDKKDYAGLRLALALIGWADDVDKSKWEAIGKSLVLSSLTNAGTGSGELYNALRLSDYYSRASWLADNGIWAWTISSAVRASYVDGNLNISASFPINMAHFMIINGVRPFIKLQIHDMDWRSDNQFERYDSSGWVYYPQEQILIVKVKHRSTIENIRVFYRVQEPVIIEEDSADTEVNANIERNYFDSE